MGLPAAAPLSFLSIVCRVLLLSLAFIATDAAAEGLDASNLGVIYNRDNAASARVARYFVSHRQVPQQNLVGLSVPDRAMISREQLKLLRTEMLRELPTNVQSLLLVWSRPYAVECMSITTAFAAGYQPGFCEPGCQHTLTNPFFDTHGWLPADTVGWLPAMLLPSTDEALATSIVERGVRADGTWPAGTIYLVRTQDTARNVRAGSYADAEAALSGRIAVVDLTTPVLRPLADVLAYFTGAVRVDEISRLSFLPGAAADHLTSYGGRLDGNSQMSALEWLRHGATASYGSVSEPCAFPGKFPDPKVFAEHYRDGDTLLEAYWKSVAMPGQGLFIGEPLSRPYAHPN